MISWFEPHIIGKKDRIKPCIIKKANMSEVKPLFALEPKRTERKQLVLTDKQKNAVRRITLGIEEVDERVRQMAQEDVVHTLENGHPLNRLITNDSGEVIGYIACEDFVPGEAYLKYFGSAGGTGLNPLREIPVFLEYAKEKGYQKLNFHGWNKRLNHVLERYGFERLRTDSMGDLQADFYEKTLTEVKSHEQVTDARKQAFEAKYIQKLNQEYEQTIKSFSDKDRAGKEMTISQAFQNLSDRLSKQDDLTYKDLQKTVLKLKLARHYQKSQDLDLNSLFDAIIETPNFINNDKGSLNRLLEVHEQKTLQKIAEMRKRRAEETGDQGFNPWENLLTAKSGNYYLARLLNMPHLQLESQYMDHCVGTSDSYVNRIKKGEIDILSFRLVPKYNSKTQKVEGDTSLLTIEYDLKSGTIMQIKKKSDGLLAQNDPYFNDVLDALRQLQQTRNDLGQPRVVNKINPSELQNFKVKPYHLLTDRGEVHFRNLNAEDHAFILKTGTMELTPDISRLDASKLIRIFEGVNFSPEQIARTPEEINSTTRAYVGRLVPNIFRLLPKEINHVYTSFPEGRIKMGELMIGGKSKDVIATELKANSIHVSGYAESMMQNNAFTTMPKPEEIDTVRLKVGDLGFTNYPTTDELFERAKSFGLELCPAEVGPHMRLADTKQPLGEWYYIAMKQMAGSDGDPRVFGLAHDGAGFWAGGAVGRLWVASGGVGLSSVSASNLNIL